MERAQDTRGCVASEKNTGKTSLAILIPITVFFMLILFYLQYKEKTSRRGLSSQRVGEGLKYEKEKNFNLALGEYDKAIELNPKNALAYSARSNVYWQMGDLDKAIEDLSMSIQLYPNAPTYMMRAHRYEKKGEIEKAILDYSKVLEIEPGFSKIALPRKQRLCNSPQLPDEKKKALCQ